MEKPKEEKKSDDKRKSSSSSHHRRHSSHHKSNSKDKSDGRSHKVQILFIKVKDVKICPRRSHQGFKIFFPLLLNFLKLLH